VPRRRQTLFFSATMPPPIRELSREMLHQPALIQRERATVAPVGIVQAVYPVRQDLKSALLVSLLSRGDIRQALVFTRTKHRANRLTDFLVRAGLKADRIHGNRSQNQRTAALDGFREGRIPILVATDIAARGIDVHALGHVVNFDVPLVPEDYIHRIGRTGRAEAAGEAFTFVSNEERQEIAAIERALGRTLPRVTVPDFDYDARPAAKLEVPIAQRMAQMRERRAGERARGQARRGRQGGGSGSGSSGRGRGSGSPGEGGGPAAPGAPGGKKWTFRPRRRR